MRCRSASEDMTRYNSLGGSANTARTGSSGLAVPQQDDLTQAVASPKSSLGSSLPSVPTSLKIAQVQQPLQFGHGTAHAAASCPRHAVWSHARHTHKPLLHAVRCSHGCRCVHSKVPCMWMSVPFLTCMRESRSSYSFSFFA